MGIQFDLLSDVLLLEDSPFSKFFSGKEPIRTIHKELRVSHTADLELQKTQNRHDMWDAIRVGDGLFVVIKSKDSVEAAKKTLTDTIKKYSPNPSLKRTYNEFKDIIKKLISSVTDENTSAYEINRIRKRIFARDDIVDKMVKLYKNGQEASEIHQAVINLLNAGSAGDRILIKRIADSPSSPFSDPGARKFEVARKGGGKVFGQQYAAWVFNGDSLIDASTYECNATDLWKPNKGGLPQLGGWADREYYIIKNTDFLRTRKHPFTGKDEPYPIDQVKIVPNTVDRKDPDFESKIETIDTDKLSQYANGKYNMWDNKKMQWIPVTSRAIPSLLEPKGPRQDKILILNNERVSYFVTDSFNQFKRVIIDKMKQGIEATRQKTISDIENVDEPDSTVQKSVDEYRKLLKTINQGFSHINPVKAFGDFVLKDVTIDLDNYDLIHTDSLFGGDFNPLKTDKIPWRSPEQKTREYSRWKKTNSANIKNKIIDLMRSTILPTTEYPKINVRDKNDRKNITKKTMDELRSDPNSNNFEIWDSIQKRWIPFDKGHDPHDYSNVSYRGLNAILFRNQAEYDDFKRKFVRYTLKSMVKTKLDSEIQDLVDLL